MVNKMMAAVVAVPVLAGLGWGAFEINRQVQCQSLETDYLNAVSSLKGNASIRVAIGEDAESDKDFDRLQELDLERIKATLSSIYDDCGMRAGQTAARKGSEIMF